MDKAYNAVPWQNAPSNNTPLGATNLLRMGNAINTIDDRVIYMDTSKANQSTINGVVQSITYNDATGVLTITKVNGTSTTIDTKLEKLAVNFSYNSTTQQLDITLDDGTVQHVDMSSLVTQYEFQDTDTVSFSVQPDGKIKANIINGSITADMLQPDYLADIIVQSNIAVTNANLSKRYAVGGVETGDTTDNAKYYKEQAQTAAAEAEAIAGFNPTDYYKKTEINTIVGDRSLLPTPNTDLVNSINDVDTQIKQSVKYKDYIEHTEYLIHYHDKIRKNEFSTIITRGDSTTEGASITDSNFLIDKLCKKIINNGGYYRGTVINRGVGGATTSQWNSIYLTQDLALNPDLYILRWGINDGANPVETRLQLFTDALRNGLTTIRNQKSVNDLSIILMMPNSVSDVSHGRDNEWIDLIYPVVRQASKDFYCCFIDTYHYLYDSTNVVWGDTPGGIYGSAHIHPLETGNSWIASLMSESLIPTSLRNYGVTNIGSEVTKLATDKPSTYTYGVSINRTLPANGFPYDGQVQTVRSVDGVLYQINTSYVAQAVESYAIRRGTSNTGISGSIGDDAWASWLFIHGEEGYNNLTLENSWVYSGNGLSTPRFYKDRSDIVHVRGGIASGTITIGTRIANLPTGYRPTEAITYTVATNAGAGTVRVYPTGDILVAGITDNTLVDLGFISFNIN